MNLKNRRVAASAVLIAAIALTAGAVQIPAQAISQPTTANPQVVLDWNATAVAIVLASGANQV